MVCKMTESQTDRIAAALERIADALEFANELREYELGGDEPHEGTGQSLD